MGQTERPEQAAQGFRRHAGTGLAEVLFSARTALASAVCFLCLCTPLVPQPLPSAERVNSGDSSRPLELSLSAPELFSYRTGRLRIVSVFAFRYGTHIRSASLQTSAALELGRDPWGPLTAASLTGRFGLSAAVRHLGLPGAAEEAALEFGSLLERNRHAVGLAGILYLSTDGTSQLNYLVSYAWRCGPHRIELSAENNLPMPDELRYAFTENWVDEYRTAGVTLRYLNGEAAGAEKPAHVLGLELGLTLWTGTRGLTENLERGETYDLTGRHGAEFSHGILYAAVILDGLKLSAGWDSEGIRDFFQNGVHRLINEGSMPLLDRPPRFYFQVNLGGIGLRY